MRTQGKCIPLDEDEPRLATGVKALVKPFLNPWTLAHHQCQCDLPGRMEARDFPVPRRRFLLPL
jgi:hypothetical protein